MTKSNKRFAMPLGYGSYRRHRRFSRFVRVPRRLSHCQATEIALNSPAVAIAAAT